MYEIIAENNRAKRGRLTTRDGVIETPVFMNVATQGAIKGAVEPRELTALGCQVVLANTYHLHVRPGDGLVREMGGLRAFIGWDGPTLTDSGGFQVFSLAKLRRVREDGVCFASHVDGRRLFIGPEESAAIQANLGSTVAMAFDECAPYPCERRYMEESAARTVRWLERHRAKAEELSADIPPERRQLLFGINQGGTYADIRAENAARIAELGLPGYAVGGLAVGESAERMYEILDVVTPILPRDKPTYLMGVGTPENILEAVERGVDFFDCVLPARNGRHANLYTSRGRINMHNKRFERDPAPIDANCSCPVCRTYSRAYLRHLFKAGEMLAMRLAVAHNLYFYNSLTARIREAIEGGVFAEFKRETLEALRSSDVA
ncbi:MAG: tRNA guanosine(34) transglycosylase Tgt [Clostridiales bacterium]|jgi:queuine tRNA-ribosyltransferase|nr:tRNA guanosine(34) transglycosylase Tgt [Clostridiales bacterium]